MTLNRKAATLLIIALTLALSSVGTALGTGGGNQGCTPGYWKNHLDSWVVYAPDQQVETVFNPSAPFNKWTLLAALDGGGGPGLDGAVRILLRAGVAALLNGAPGSGVYAYYSHDTVIGMVNLALKTGNRATILAVASELDARNNQGCPLN
jgi:hypothetical protein